MYNTTIQEQLHIYKINKHRLKILIVDDDDNARNSLKDLIELRGHKVITLDEGMKCVNRCSENTFDIIFMDYHIGDLDGDIHGTDIVGMIRDCFGINCPIYAYTGDNSNEVISNIKSQNMKGAFIKPVSSELINDFFNIIEKNINDNKQLKKMSIKEKNFIYF